MVASAQADVVLNYEGRVTFSGTNFNRPAFFVFSIQDTNGQVLWASGDLPKAGDTNLPAGVRWLSLRDGNYRTRLGDAGLQFPGLKMAALRAAGAPFLRVWLKEGPNAWLQLPQDASLADALKALPDPEKTYLTVAQGEEILREIRELRAQLTKGAAVAPVPAEPEPPKIVAVRTGGSPAIGSNSAPVVLVEFTDFECPFCKRAHDDLMPTLKKKYVETGKLRIVMRNYPLSFHPHAEPAAMAALCAMQQERFYPMRERLFAMNTNLSLATYMRIASELNLETNLFAACLNGKAFATQLAEDQVDARLVGISGTPSFVIGRAEGAGDDERIRGNLMVGAKPLAFFEAEIERYRTNPPPVEVETPPEPAMNYRAMGWPEVKTLLASNAIVLVDTRFQDSYDRGHIPGAISFPAHGQTQATLLTFMEKYPKDTRFVLYCGSEACRLWQSLADGLVRIGGYTNIAYMPGGYMQYFTTESVVKPAP